MAVLPAAILLCRLILRRHRRPFLRAILIRPIPDRVVLLSIPLIAATTTITHQSSLSSMTSSPLVRRHPLDATTLHQRPIFSRPLITVDFVLRMTMSHRLLQRLRILHNNNIIII